MIAVSTGSMASYSFRGAGIRPHSFIVRFIETAGEINEFMKMHGVNLVERGLKPAGKWIYGAVIGLACQRKISYPWESPFFKVIEVLVNVGAVFFTSLRNIKGALMRMDCAVFLVDLDLFWGNIGGDDEWEHCLAGGSGREEFKCIFQFRSHYIFGEAFSRNDGKNVGEISAINEF